MYGQLIQQSIQEAVTRQRDGRNISLLPSSQSAKKAESRPLSRGHPTSKVYLHLSCRNLRKKDQLSNLNPMVVVSLQKKDGGTTRYDELGRTEVVKNSFSPDFSTVVEVDFYKDVLQRLLFEVYDVESPSAKLRDKDFVGRTIIPLAKIVEENSCKKALETKCGLEIAGDIIISVNNNFSQHRK